MSRNPELRVGISGWRYAGWRGGFYPEGLPQRAELEYASRRLNSIEINGTFYSLSRTCSACAIASGRSRASSTPACACSAPNWAP